MRVRILTLLTGVTMAASAITTACKVSVAPPKPPAVPMAPTSLVVQTASDSQLDLNWADESSDETGFKLERSFGGTGNFIEIATLGAGVTGYSDIGLTPNTTYTYRVRATGDAGSSDYSAAVSATTDLFYASFNSDVFAGGWTRTNTSVSVDVAKGLLRIGTNGANDDLAQAPVNTQLPVTIRSRMRLVSGGQNYRLPQISVGYGASEQSGIYVTYLPGSGFGWALGPAASSFTNTNGNSPSTTGVWVTVTAEIRSNGGVLYSQMDGQSARTQVATASWSIPSQMTVLYLKQPWDAVCEFDYVSVHGAIP